QGEVEEEGVAWDAVLDVELVEPAGAEDDGLAAERAGPADGRAEGGGSALESAEDGAVAAVAGHLPIMVAGETHGPAAEGLRHRGLGMELVAGAVVGGRVLAVEGHAERKVRLPAVLPHVGVGAGQVGGPAVEGDVGRVAL